MNTGRRINDESLRGGAPDRLTAMVRLATIYFKLGEAQEMKKFQLHALELTRRILGNENPDTLLVVSNLAVACFNLGDLQEAAELKLEVLETHEMVLGKDHPLSQRARTALAAIRDAIDAAA